MYAFRTCWFRFATKVKDTALTFIFNGTPLSRSCGSGGRSRQRFLPHTCPAPILLYFDVINSVYHIVYAFICYLHILFSLFN